MNITDADKRALVTAFERDLERNDVREHHKDSIMSWLDGEITTIGVLECIVIGHMEVVGVTENGSPTFRLTKKGFDHVEQLKRTTQ